MKKKESDNLINELIKNSGYWPCRFCSNENWIVNHRPEETVCSKTNEPREIAEIKYEYKG